MAANRGQELVDEPAPMISHVPGKMFFTKGVGKHKEKLTSFEMALRNAGIAEFNLITVSSILPTNCKIVPRREGVKDLTPGQIVPVVMSRSETDEPHRLIAASIGLAVPTDNTHYGYLSEHHSHGENDSLAGDYVEDIAATMLATILGVDFDPDASWDDQREIWRISGKIVETRNVTQSAIGSKTNLWTTVLAAAVLI